jgi:phosphoribosyl 1,2-cyclic phosphate phosphodiesterase
MIELGTDFGLCATILGCGSSGGVPRLGNNQAEQWGGCDPAEPRNRRRRCSLLVEQGATKVLVDTSPDMRGQLLDAKCGRLHGVVYTHDHADQAHGVDDLRMIAYAMRKRVPVYMDAPTSRTMFERFGYCFKQQEGSNYPAILDAHEMPDPGSVFRIEGEGDSISVMPFLQHHGEIDSLGFRFGPVAYSADVVGLPEVSFEILEGVSCWIVDCLRYTPHPSHAHLELTLEWIARVKPKLAVLTNLHVDLDYQTLLKELPEGVIPAYDMMKISF